MIAKAVEEFKKVRPEADTVLVCEDDEQVLKLAIRWIQGETRDLSLKIIGFSSAEEALAHLEDPENGKKVLALVSDRNMAGVMKGEEFAAQLRRNGDEQSPFLLATTDVADGAVEEVMATGAIDGLLAKPYDRDQLVLTLALAITARQVKIGLSGLMETHQKSL